MPMRVKQLALIRALCAECSSGEKKVVIVCDAGTE